MDSGGRRAPYFSGVSPTGPSNFSRTLKGGNAGPDDSADGSTGRGDSCASAAVRRFPEVTFWGAVTAVVISSAGCSRSWTIRNDKHVTPTLSATPTLATASIRVRFMTSPHAVQSVDGKT